MINLFSRLRSQLLRCAEPTRPNLDVALLDSRVLFSANPLAATIETAEDAPAFDVDLHELFTIDDGQANVVFEVQDAPDQHLESLAIEDGQLQLLLADNAHGEANLSILASVGELTQHLDLTLEIESVNDAPTFLGFAEPETSGDVTTVDLFAAFEDAEDDDGQLVFEVASLGAGFAGSSIDHATGILTLYHAADASGLGQVLVTATDSGGLTTGEATSAGFRVYDAIQFGSAEASQAAAEIGLSDIQFWTSWNFFKHVDGAYDYSELDVEGFRSKILQNASDDSKIVFDIENEYYTNTEEGRDRFAEVLHHANELRPDLDFGFYRMLPERQWWAPVNWARVQEDAALDLNTYFTVNSDQFESSYNRWLDRNENYRTETVSAEFGGQTIHEMVDTVYPSLYTFFFENERSSTHKFEVQIDSDLNRLTTADAAYLESEWVFLRATKDGYLNNGLKAIEQYYIVNRDGNSFQLAHSKNGPAIELNNDFAGRIYAEAFDVWDRMKLDRSISDWQVYARDNIAEARKFGDKDVVPWLSPSIAGQGKEYLSGDFFRQQLETVKELGDSVALFDLNGQYQNDGWWTALSDFMQSLDGPAATVEVDFDAIAPETRVANADTFSGVENTSLTISRTELLANDESQSEPDIQITKKPKYGRIVWASDGQSFDYTPKSGFTGIDTIEYQLVNNGPESNIASITLEITPATEPVVELPVPRNDEPPQASDDTFEILVNGGLNVSLSELLVNDRLGASDIDATDPSDVAVTLVDSPLHGKLTITPDNRLHYSPDRDFSGVDQATYRITSETGTSELASIQFRVAAPASSDLDPPIEEPAVEVKSGGGLVPEAISDAFKIGQGKGLNISVAELLQNDQLHGGSLGDDVTIEIVNDPQNGVATVTPDHRLHYSPAKDFFGSDRLQYRLTNANGSSEVASVDIQVEPHVEISVKSASGTATQLEPVKSFGVKLNGGLNVSLTELFGEHSNQLALDATTPELDATTPEIVQESQHGTLTITPDGRLHYSPYRDFLGVDRISLRVAQEDGTVLTQRVDLVVFPEVDAISRTVDAAPMRRSIEPAAAEPSPSAALSEATVEQLVEFAGDRLLSESSTVGLTGASHERDDSDSTPTDWAAKLAAKLDG